MPWVWANLQPTTSGTPHQVPGDSRLRGGKAPGASVTIPCDRAPGALGTEPPAHSRRFSGQFLLRSEGAARPQRDSVPRILDPHGIACRQWEASVVERLSAEHRRGQAHRYEEGAVGSPRRISAAVGSGAESQPCG